MTITTRIAALRATTAAIESTSGAVFTYRKGVSLNIR